MRFVRTAESIFDIPSGFTRVEYLETSGSKYYIDTGYKANNTTKIEIKTQGQTWIFGGRTSIAVGDSLGVCFNANLVALQFGSQSINYNQTGIAQQVSECVISQDGAYINGVLRASFISETFSCPNNLYLFDINNNGSLGDGLKGKMWYCKIWDNDTLVRDFIPCIDPLGVACMYDLVGKKPYYNLGTGTFTTGRQIIPVEYLEGTGTQYIDTGVRGFADFEIGIKLRESVPNVSIFCGNNYRLERYNASNPYWRFRNNNDFYNSGVPITEYHVMAWKNDEIYSDDVKLQDFAKTWNVSANMTLFGASASSSYPSMIYFCKLWNQTDGTLLRDYIPCKDENDNGFLFDKISGTVYLNAGTGAFSVGENKYTSKLRLIKDTDGKVSFIQDVLPREYRPLKYLQSTGTQYINTGYKPNNNTKVVARFKMNETASTFLWLFLTRDQNVAGAGFGFGSITSGYISSEFNNRVSSSTDKLTSGTIYDIVKDKNICKYNNKTLTNTDSTFSVNYPLVLFGLNNVGTIQQGTIPKANCYYFVIYDNGVPVRDLYPALRKSDNKPGMYDRITKQFFTNASESGNDFNYE